MAGMGLPTASEMLDPIIPQFISDLISWASVGARTTESQTHRNMASGLSMPVGFKNGTDGSIQTAIDALQSAINPHSFMGIDEDGRSCILNTSGNPSVHLILRGGKHGPNYYEEYVEDAEELMRKAGINPALLIDCSHANSGKNPEKQLRVLRSIMDQRKRHADTIKGFMIESNLFAGNQPIPGEMKNLQYGVSVTDGCVGWESTEEMLEFVYTEMQARG
jgi:3-deoxy-7-phosphoheptulonate synthase